MNKEVKRGYVKWTDEDGVFHKELLTDHPELLARAEPKEQLMAEEARRLNAAADEQEKVEDNTVEVLNELRSAPEDILTASQLTEETEVASAAEEPVVEGDKPDMTEELNEDHAKALLEFRQRTSE